MATEVITRVPGPAPQPVTPVSTDRLVELFGRHFGRDNLNVGCGLRHFPGFKTLDLDPQTKPDVVWDMENTPLPFEAESLDCIFGSHVFEHVRNFIPLVEDFYRILRPGGRLISITPYLGSDDAWASPAHVRGFDENTWHYFNQKLYNDQECDSAGYGAWQGYRGNFQAIEIALVPYPGFANDPELDFKKKHWRNVIQEVHAVMIKV